MSGNVRWRGQEFGDGQFIVWEGDPNTSKAYVAGTPVPNEP